MFAAGLFVNFSALPSHSRYDFVRRAILPISGPDGTIAAFAGLEVGRKIFVHMNNTNPVLRPGSPERAAAEAAGWEIACDGMVVAL